MRKRSLQQYWIRIIFLLCVLLLIEVIGTLGIYYIYQQQQILVFGGAVAGALASALLATIRKFRW